MRGMRGKRVRRASQASQTCEACESALRGIIMTSNQIKKTDKGVGVYFKGQNVESVLSSQGYFIWRLISAILENEKTMKINAKSIGKKNK